MRVSPAGNTGTLICYTRTAEMQIKQASLGSMALLRHINMPWINSCLLKQVIIHIFKVQMSDHLSH